MRHLIRRPLVWAGVYAFLIVGFSLIFMLMPYSFYQTTIKYEPYFQNQAEAISAEVTGEIKKNLIENGGKYLYQDDPDQIDCNDLIYDLEVNTFASETVPTIDRKEIVFQFIFFKNYGTVEKPDLGGNPVKLILKHNIDFGVLKRNDSKMRLIEKDIENAQGGQMYDFELQTLATQQGRVDHWFPENLAQRMSTNKKDGMEYVLSKYHGRLYLSGKFRKAVYDFLLAQEGITSIKRGGLLRAIYLSTTTITTMGYGDIVPITDWARIWIMIEVLLGIVVLGLFIFALTKSVETSSETRGSRPPRSES